MKSNKKIRNAKKYRIPFPHRGQPWTRKRVFLTDNLKKNWNEKIFPIFSQALLKKSLTVRLFEKTFQKRLHGTETKSEKEAFDLPSFCKQKNMV